MESARSHCLSSSTVLGAGSLYVVSSKTIQMVSRGFTSREFAGRSSFAINFPNPSGTLSVCAPPFYLQGFPTFLGHISLCRCARNFEIVKWIFFIPFCVVELLRINKMGRKNMAGKNSRSCTFGAKLQKYYNSVNFSFEIALKRYLDKFLTWISLHLLKEAWNAFCKIQLTIGTNFWNAL